MEGRLFVVGTGMQLGHLTMESKNVISSSKKVLYLISDFLTENYVKKLNPTAESLSNFYEIGKDRRKTYDEMVDYIIKTLEDYKDLCVAFYGHPGVFTYPSHKVIEIAKELHFEARMLPGISTEDMIFSELGIDPASYGLQSFESTYFLLKSIEFDPRSYVILWQIGVLGKLDYQNEPDVSEQLEKLQKVLLQKYPINHEIIFYKISNLNIFESEIIITTLQDLTKIKFHPISTLIIRPIV